MKRKVHIQIARLLLLYFATVIIPLDLYHHHAGQGHSGRPEISSPKGYTQSVADLCLICHFHLDTQACLQTASLHLLLGERSVTLTLDTYQLKLYGATSTHFSLRGPPTVPA